MNMSSYTRRLFLKTSVAGGGAVVSGQFSGYRFDGVDAASAASVHAPSWIDKPMRWAQLTLVEDDPGKFDLAFWLDYFKRTHSDGACLSGGGCVAYYPTKIPFHHASAWLGERDVLGELISGCRKLAWSYWCVPTRTRPTTTLRRHTRIGSPWTPTGSLDGIGPRRKCGSLARS